MKERKKRRGMDDSYNHNSGRDYDDGNGDDDDDDTGTYTWRVELKEKKKKEAMVMMVMIDLSSDDHSCEENGGEKMMMTVMTIIRITTKMIMRPIPYYK